jgi:hypothetical protein
VPVLVAVAMLSPPCPPPRPPRLDELDAPPPPLESKLGSGVQLVARLAATAQHRHHETHVGSGSRRTTDESSAVATRSSRRCTERQHTLAGEHSAASCREANRAKRVGTAVKSTLRSAFDERKEGGQLKAFARVELSRSTAPIKPAPPLDDARDGCTNTEVTPRG